MLPRLGDTEREALEAGTVWWDGELFSRRPRLAAAARLPRRGAHARRSAPSSTVRSRSSAARLDDWEVAPARRPAARGLGAAPERALLRDDHPRGVRRARLLGAGALGRDREAREPQRHLRRDRDGAELARARRSCCSTTAPTQQKRHYLPRLARGEEIPCFALTGPEAGSDAAAMQSEGVVCRGKWDGREVLGMRLALAQALHHARARSRR